MSGPPWEEVARVFGLVMDADAHQRAAILDRACGDDEDLRREVEELLAADAGDAHVADVVLDAVEQILTQGGPPPGAPEEALARAGLSPGALIDDRYQVDRLLGVGGMGVVVAAHHTGLAEPVAIKVLDPDALVTERTRRRFLREARAAARIKSAHVVKVRDTGTLATGAPYLVMDRLEGADLAHVLQRRGALPARDACRVTLQACEALATAHASGVIHRDIKPGNLFLERVAHGELTVKLLDFGISKLAEADGDEALTGSRDTIGSPAYMSPEQLRSARDVDARSDIWSLGVVLYEMLTGQRPFRAASLADVSMRILAEPPPPLEGSWPPALDEVVLRCLAKDRAHRYPDVGALARALAPFGGSQGHRTARRVEATLATPVPEDLAPEDAGLEGAFAPTRDGDAASEPSVDAAVSAAKAGTDGRPRWPRAWLGGAVLAAAGVGLGVWVSASPDDPSAASPASSPAVAGVPSTAAPPPASATGAPPGSTSVEARDEAPPGPLPASAPPRPGPRPLPPSPMPSVDPYGSRR